MSCQPFAIRSLPDPVASRASQPIPVCGVSRQREGRSSQFML